MIREHGIEELDMAQPVEEHSYVDALTEFNIEPDLYISQEQIKKNAERYVNRHGDFLDSKNKKSDEKSEYKRIQKYARKRKFETTATVLLVLLVGFFAILVLYPQMQLSELSRDNSDVKDNIAKLEKEIIDSEEEINGVTDMDSLRAQALALGMQDPNSNQVVNIPMPKNDKLTTVVAYDANGVSEEAYNAAIQNLADYYLAQMQ